MLRTRAQHQWSGGRIYHELFSCRFRDPVPAAPTSCAPCSRSTDCTVSASRRCSASSSGWPSALLFVAVYSGTGGESFIRGLVEGLDLSPTAVVLVMMAIVFALGFVMDPIGILFLTMPIFIPIVSAIGFDPILFGGLVILNLEMAYLTPPFGYNLFYLKSVAPPAVILADLYRAAPAFVALQALGLAICWLVPEIVTGLPEAVLGR
ncbi:TRAP transporter large permease subunit [Salinarimonas rosea]|uniref:TRAP transporter large permease subunit n=1 Tax=Salinarimonas rosea TaxID=552063 RepID=UPI0004130206|nr:TRAP transporter large permease subunit [Salinarimonas rosea]